MATNNINEVVLCGHLTENSELKSPSNNNNSFLTFNIAVNESRKNTHTNTWEDRPNFFDCAIYNNARALVLAPYLVKGTRVTICGKLVQHRWQDQNTGQNRSRVIVAVNEIDFMSVKNGQDSTAGSNSNNSQTNQGMNTGGNQMGNTAGVGRWSNQSGQQKVVQNGGISSNTQNTTGNTAAQNPNSQGNSGWDDNPYF